MLPHRTSVRREANGVSVATSCPSQCVVCGKGEGRGGGGGAPLPFCFCAGLVPRGIVRNFTPKMHTQVGPESFDQAGTVGTSWGCGKQQAS